MKEISLGKIWIHFHTKLVDNYLACTAQIHESYFSFTLKVLQDSTNEVEKYISKEEEVDIKKCDFSTSTS